MDIPILEVDFYHEGLIGSSGVSKPIVITASDGNEYFVKNQNVYSPKDKSWIKFNADFFQEFLVSRVASFLDISTPDIAIINITDDLLNDNPTLRWKQHFETGLHFATKKIENVQNNLLKNYGRAYAAGQPYTIRSWNDYFASLQNSDDIPKILALDLFTLNVDRFTNLNNLIVSETNNGKKVVSFDYGHCFLGPQFNRDSSIDSKLNINALNLDSTDEIHSYSQNISEIYRTLAIQHGEQDYGLGIIFKALQKQITFKNKSGTGTVNPFSEIISYIENFDDKVLKEFIREIPEAWVVGSDWQKNEYYKFLSRQMKLTRHILLKLISDGYFENFHKGDTLTWQTDKNISIQ